MTTQTSTIQSFSDSERGRAIKWKGSFVPPDARRRARWVDQKGDEVTAPLGWCLPREHAALNLLPEVRDGALALFNVLGIPWHCGIDGGPGNNLVSSQVQCVNALMPAVAEPDLLRRAFGHVMTIGTVEEIEPGRALTFEYIGPTDYFNESPDGPRVRGSRCTSVDAAFQHVAPDGARELVLVEWKYTEQYGVPGPVDAHKNATRRERYWSTLHDPDGPVDPDVLPFDDLLVEPFYQLVRQQLLAYRLAKDPDLSYDRVLVLHVCPGDNDAYQQSLTRDSHRVVGATVSDVWRRMLRPSALFISVGNDVFRDPDVTSAAYATRYG